MVRDTAMSGDLFAVEIAHDEVGMFAVGERVSAIWAQIAFQPYVPKDKVAVTGSACRAPIELLRTG